MRDFKAFLPLLLLAVATRAIPVPEPQSIALVSAHAAVESGVASAAIEKREVKPEAETAEEEEATTEGAHETEGAPAEGEKGEGEEEKGGEKNEEASETDGVATTEGVEGVPTPDYDGGEEEVKKEEEKEVEEGVEEKVEEKEEEAVEEGAKKGEEEGEEEAEKAEGASKEEEEEGERKEVVEEEEGTPPPPGGKEEGEVGEPLPPFAFLPGRHHPVDARGPWPWGPLSLGPHPEDLPDNGVVQLGGNEVWTPRKVVVPIYVIRFDPRYFPVPGPFHSA